MAVRDETMKITKYKIAGGNPTLLVENCPDDKKIEIAKKALKDVDQVGFASYQDLPTLDMMGGEMCVNATLAFAKALGRSGKMISSGFSEPVSYSTLGTETSISFKMDYRVEGDMVLLPGIGFRASKSLLVPQTSDLPHLCSKFNLPAFGALNYDSTSVSPWIYVKQTDSMIRESACGSGSIALSILTGESRIVQSTGEVIRVYRNGNRFTVSAKVANMGGTNGRY